MMSFHEMEMRYGSGVAYQYLLEIEKAAHIVVHSFTDMDFETRLTHALSVQDSALAAGGNEVAA